MYSLGMDTHDSLARRQRSVMPLGHEADEMDASDEEPEEDFPEIALDELLEDLSLSDGEGLGVNDEENDMDMDMDD
jgi:hypothetical protein